MNKQSSYETGSDTHEQEQEASAVSVMSSALDSYRRSLYADGWSDDDFDTDDDLGVRTLAAYVDFLKEQKEQTVLTPQERIIVDAYSAVERYTDALTAYDEEIKSVDPEDLMPGGYVYEEASAQKDKVKGVPGKRKEYSNWCETIKRMGILSDYKSLTSEGYNDEDLEDEYSCNIYPSDNDLSIIMRDLTSPPRRADSKYVGESRSGYIAELFANIRRETINMNNAARLHEFIGSTVRRHNIDAERNESSRRQEAAADQAREDVNRAFTGSEENKESIIMPQDWKERQDFVKEWFANHDPNQITPDNLEVARKYFAEEIEMQARSMRRAREKHPDVSAARYAANIAGIFGTGFTIGGDFRPVDVVVVRKLQKDGVVREINSAQYAALRIETVAEAIGLDVHDLTKDYDGIFQRVPVSSRRGR